MTRIAERAAPGADCTHDHERRRAVGEAFAEIRAVGFLAYGMKPILMQGGGQLTHALGAPERRANPFRLAQLLIRRGRDDLDRNAARHPRLCFVPREARPMRNPSNASMVRPGDRVWHARKIRALRLAPIRSSLSRYT